MVKKLEAVFTIFNLGNLMCCKLFDSVGGSFLNIAGTQMNCIGVNFILVIIMSCFYL